MLKIKIIQQFGILKAFDFFFLVKKSDLGKFQNNLKMEEILNSLHINTC